MYKLREARLREFYATGEMDSTDFGITKTPLTPSHGESLADQSFQSFKTKEIRDSESPTHELKYTRGGVIVPDTSGWNVVTSSEVSPDGKSYKTESLATTEGTQKISGGHTQFVGKNEHLQKASHQGDDKNYVKTAAETSKTQLQEKTVVGDENSGRVEQKSSSVVSSSHMSTSKYSSSGPEAVLDHQKVLNEFDQLVDSATSTRHQQQQQQHQKSVESRSSTVRKEHQVREQHHEEQHQQQQQQQHYKQTQNERYIIEDNTNQDRLRTNQVRTNETNQNEQIKRKLIQEEVDLLAAAPGKIVSRTVEYPDPNTKVITETKTLPDGTTVTTRKFETKSASSKSWSTSSNQKECTSSRTIVEDRAQRNRVEYVVDGKEHVISDDYNVKRITEKPTPQILRDTDRRTVRDDKQQQQQQQHTFTKQTVQQQQVHDRVDQNVERSMTKEDKIRQEETRSVRREETRKQESDIAQKEVTKVRDIKSVDTADRVAIDRAEKLKDQVETIALDSTHRTVKKDLSQTVRDAKITNQDFIETERGCAMVDYTQRTPEKYTVESRPDTTVKQTHSTTQQHDHREQIIEISREGYPATRPQKPSQDFTTQGFPSVRPQKADEPKKPSQDFTTHGFPSVKPQKPEGSRKPSDDFTTHGFPSAKPQKRDQDFTTQGFPSVKPQKPDDRSPTPQRPGDVLYPSTRPFRPDDRSPTTQKTGDVLYPSTRPSRPDDRTPKPEDIRTQGYPSTKPEKSGDQFDSPSSKTTQSYVSASVEQRSTEAQRLMKSTEQKTVTKQTEDFTTHGFPSARPDRVSPTKPSESPKQIEDHPHRTPQQPQRIYPTEHVQDVRHTTETRKTTEQRQVHKEKEDFTTRGFPAVQPDRTSPTKPEERPKYIEERPLGRPQQPDRTYPTEQTEDIRTVSETREITQQREVQRKQQDFTTQGFPSAKPQQHDRLYPQGPDRRDEKPQQPDQLYPAGRRPQEPDRLDGRPQQPDQMYPSGGRPQEQRPQYPEQVCYPYQKPQEIAPSTPADSTRPVRPSGVPQHPEDYYQTTQTTEISSTRQRKEDFTTQGFPSARPQQPGEPQSPTTRPDQTYPSGKPSQPDIEFDDTSSVTTEHTDIFETTRRNRNEYDAAHIAFARSLRCISPVDEHRGSVKSVRTSTSSIRSSTSPDKRSRRSPSRDSDTSRFSSGTITKTREQKDVTKRTITPTTRKSPSSERPTPRDVGRPKDQPDLYRSNQTVDLTKSRIDKEKREIKQTTQTTQRTEDTKASRLPYSSTEGSTRPGQKTPDRGIHPSRPADSVGDIPKSPKKPDSRTPSRQTEPVYDVPKSPKKTDTKSPSTPQTERRKTSDTTKTTKFTKTEKIENAILRDDRKPRPKQPTGKPQFSDHEDFELESPRSPSPSYPKGTHIYPREATDLDSTDITVEVNLKNVGRDVDLMTTITDTDSTKKRYVSEEFIGREKEDIEINRRTRTDEEVIEDLKTTEKRRPYPAAQSPERETPIQEDRYPDSRRPYPSSPERESPTREGHYAPDSRPQPSDQSPDREISSRETHYPNETGEPFYLIPSQPKEEGKPKKPEETKKPKPPLNRSETYEERCRKILGMDERTSTTETKKTKTSETEDFVTTERTVQERDRTRRLPSPVPSPRSTSPRKPAPVNGDDDLLITTTKTVITTEETKTRSPTQSPTRRSKLPTREQSPTKEPGDGYGTPKDSYTPTVSPYSSLSRKSTPKDTPTDSPHSRSPASSPTRKHQPSPRLTETIPTSREPARKVPATKEPQKREPSTIDIEEEIDVRRRSDRSSLIKQETYEVEDTSTTQKIRQTSSRSPETSPIRRSPSPSAPRSPGQSPDRYGSSTVEYRTTEVRKTTDKTTRRPGSLGTSPTRREPYTTEVCYEITDRKVGRIPKDSPESRSPATSPTRKTETIPRSTEQSPTRRGPYSTDVEYTTTVSKSATDKMRDKTEVKRTVKSVKTGEIPRSPDRSPVKQAPKSKPSVESPHIRPTAPSSVRKTQPTTRPTERSPSRRVPSTTEIEYETTLIKKTSGKTTDSLDIDRRISSTSVKGVKPEEVHRSPERSPIRRGPQTSDIKTTPKRTPTSRSPAPSPSRLRTPTSRPSEVSPSRRSPSSVDIEYETTIHTETRDRKVDVSRKSSTTSVKTTKTIETSSRTQEQPNHVTTAKIQLSPTPVRKITSPEKKTPREPETRTVKTIRSTTTVSTPRDDVTKTPKSTVQRSPLKQPTEKVQPGRRTDIKKVQEISTQQQRKRVEKKVIRVDEESDSSMVREKEELTIVKETKTGPTTTSKKSPTKRFPVTERKESAPVYGTRSTKDTTQKMIRSTSDNLIKSTVTKRTKPEIETTLVGPGTKTPRKTSTDKTPKKSDRRPSKHLATKTINLTTTSNIINSEDMENVIIDIQQAKSSREPSPNKIIPTPVPLDEDIGVSRYPDTVQEPDEEPRRKPKVQNIPIFEEETNNYVGCHITEVDETYEERMERLAKTKVVSDEEEIIKTTKTTTTTKRDSSPYKDRPKHVTENDIVDDECLLSVHDKVTKFITTAEEIKKPKPSAPFRRETPPEEFPEKDDCLLSVNAKVNKFLTTAESITKPIKSSSPKPVGRPNIDEIDEELRTDECVLSVSEKVNKFINTAEQLVGPSPQRSPELVAKVERQISRQSDDSEREVTSKATTKTSVTERYTPGKPKPGDKPSSPKPVLKSSEAIRKAKQVFENGTTSTTTTTTRQKDILSRPSVWEGRKTTTDVRLQDIGVYKKHGKETEEEIFERTERHSSRSPARDVEDYPTRPLKSSSILTDSVSSKKDLFESRISSSKTDVYNTQTTKTKSGIQTTKTTPKSTGDKSPTRTRPDSDEYDLRIKQTTTRYSPSREVPSPDDQPSSVTRRPSSRPYDEHSPSRTTTTYVERHTKHTTSTTKRPGETSPSKHPGSPSPRRHPESPKTPSSRPQDYSSRPKDHSERHHIHSRITSDSVSAKRNIFEKTEHDSRTITSTHGPTPSYMDQTMSSLEHIRREPIFEKTEHDSRTTTPTPGQRPSYMDHTLSSLEHIRGDSMFEKTEHDSRTTTSTYGPRPSYMDQTMSSLEHIRRDPIFEKTEHDSRTTTSTHGPRPSYMDHTLSSLEHIRGDSMYEKTEHDSRTTTPTPGPRPSYMDPTMSSLKHIRRDSVEVNKNYLRKSSVDSSIHEHDGRTKSGTKFGVELKRVESKGDKTRRKSSSSDVPHIEEIFDLELLERMLHTVVGYEQRRRIRSQIRVVKKIIETQNREAAHTEYTTIIKQERSSSRGSTPRGSTPSPDRGMSPSRKESYKTSASRFIETESEHISRHVEKVVKERSSSPQSKVKSFETVKEVRKISDKSTGKKPGLIREAKDEKPIWATKNILRKTSENDKNVKTGSVKKTSTSTSTVTRTQSQKQKILSDEDCVTSSYGIGPTDEDGRPLFGIRALKKKSPSETTKVTGTVITEKYYSENGAQPVGERKVTVYSTSPDDIQKFESKFDNRQSGETIKRERSSKDGVTTVTRVEKISKCGDPEVSYHEYLE